MEKITIEELNKLEEIQRAATHAPWQWNIEDYSMAWIGGTMEEEEFVLSVSPCNNCQKRAKQDEDIPSWKWGRCRTPTEANATLIVEMRNALPKLIEAAKHTVRLTELERQVSDLQAANNAYRDRAMLAESALKKLSNGVQSSVYTPGQAIEKRGGDYDADAKFVCQFTFEGVTRIVGAIPQKRGWLFYIFNPKQVGLIHAEPDRPPTPIPPLPTEPAIGSHWRHVKNRHLYKVVGYSLIEASVSWGVRYTTAFSGTPTLEWLRPVAEFLDGRFTREKW